MVSTPIPVCLKDPTLCVGAWQWLVSCVGFQSIALLHDPITEEMQKIKSEKAHKERLAYDLAHKEARTVNGGHHDPNGAEHGEGDDHNFKHDEVRFAVDVCKPTLITLPPRAHFLLPACVHIRTPFAACVVSTTFCLI